MGKEWIGGIIIGLGLLLTDGRAQAPAATPVGPSLGSKQAMRIGLIADAQYCDHDADIGRYYRISLEKLHQAVDTFNAQRVDLVINLGDLIDQDLESYPLAMREVQRLQMPVYHVLGNHEFWNVPFQLQRSVLDTLGLANGYCDLSLPGWRLLMLDGTDLAEYAQGAHRDLQDEAEACRSSLDGHTNKAIWNGAIGRAQMAWIERQLAEADASGERVLLFCHFPISPPGHPMTLWNEADLRVLLARHRSAEAWIAGHSHTGSFVRIDSVQHLTLAGMLMSPDSNAFAILDLLPDRMVVEGYGREPYREVPIRGSAVASVELLPPPTERPDAMPPEAQHCIDRTFVSPFGRVVFSAETELDSADKLPRLRPGVYEILEHSEGHYAYRHVVVLPR